MSASLVGSEMCIRDRAGTLHPPHHPRVDPSRFVCGGCLHLGDWVKLVAVAYFHGPTSNI
eukprot:2557863-Alexandrium_andersonii.AAC.1